MIAVCVVCGCCLFVLFISVVCSCCLFVLFVVAVCQTATINNYTNSNHFDDTIFNLR